MPDILTTLLQQQSVADSSSDWSRLLTFNQFDPTLGTLVDVRVTVTGDVAASAAIENLGATAAHAGLSLSTVISVAAPSGAAIGYADVATTGTASLGGYDGARDYAGSSGTVVSLGGTAQNVYTVTATNAAQFIGGGTVALTTTAAVRSDETGSANLATWLQSQAGAVVSLQYDYIPAGTNGGYGTYTDLGNITVSASYTYAPFLPMGVQYTTPVTYRVADSPSDWSRLLPVQQFDPSLGSLREVEFSLDGDIIGSIAVENLGTTNTWIKAGEVAKIAVDLPGSDTMTAAGSISNNFTLAGFDGSADFAGGSGRGDSGLRTDMSTANGAFQDPTLLAAFTGTGTYDVPITALGTASLDGSGNMLSELLQSVGAALTVTYAYMPAGSTANAAISCFTTGTRIATPDGAVAVEALRVGQAVLTRDGRAAPITWIGSRRVDCARHPTPQTVHPVRIRAGAFAPGMPATDLLLSPDHAVAMEGVLIPVRCLLHADAVTQVARDHVTYWHVELDRHDVLLAEGLPVESFLDTGNRSAFDGGTTIQLHPDFAAWRWEAAGCAPLAVTGAAVAAVRRRLAARATALARRARAATPRRNSAPAALR